MTVKYSAFYPAVDADGVLGSALSFTRNVNLGDWNAIPNGTQLNIGDTVTYYGAAFTVVASHIKGPATAAPDVNPNYELFIEAGPAGGSLYTWIAYADDSTGSTNFTTGAPGARTYIGIAHNKTSATESTNPSDYEWAKMQGPAGPAIIITPSQAGFIYVDGALSPGTQTITFTATLQNLTGTINWSTTPNIKTGTGSTFTINNTEMGSNAQVIVRATVGSYFQDQVLQKIADPLSDQTSANVASAIAGQAATATNADYAAITGSTKPENNADVTTTVTGPGAANVLYDYTGTTIDDTVDLTYGLTSSAGYLTTGTITATYVVLTGTINGNNSTSGPVSITVTDGLATLTVASIDTSTATIQVTMVRNGISKSPFQTIVTKVLAAQPPPSGGGGGYSSSQTSGFTTITTPWNVMTNLLTDRIAITVPTGKTTIHVVVSLSIKWTPKTVSNWGPWNIEFRLQRNTGTTGSPTWTDIGTLQNSNPDPYIDSTDEPVFIFSSAGTLSYVFDDTGRTAGTTYEYRVVGRVSSGATSGNTGGIVPTGSVTLTTP